MYSYRNFHWLFCTNVAEFRWCGAESPPSMPEWLCARCRRSLTSHNPIKRNAMVLNQWSTSVRARNVSCSNWIVAQRRRLVQTRCHSHQSYRIYAERSGSSTNNSHCLTSLIYEEMWSIDDCSLKCAGCWCICFSAVTCEISEPQMRQFWGLTKLPRSRDFVRNWRLIASILSLFLKYCSTMKTHWPPV